MNFSKPFVFFKYLSFVVLMMSAVGCGSSNRGAQLEDSVRDFFNAIRRKDNNRALAFVQAEKQKEFFFNIEKADAVRFSNIKVQRIYPDEKMDEALVTVLLEYFSPNSSSLSSTKRLYSWEYNSRAEAWFVGEATPFGSSFENSFSSSSSKEGQRAATPKTNSKTRN